MKPVSMLHDEREGCEVIRKADANGGHQRWVVLCACGVEHTEEGRRLRENIQRYWLCATCRAMHSSSRRCLVNAWPAGTIIGTWRVEEIVHSTRVLARCVCIHCGAEKTFRPDKHGPRAWHNGCSQPAPSKTFTRKTTRDDHTPSGDDPCWPRWSAMLWAQDPKCADWTTGRIEQVKAWRSNQAAAAQTMTIDDWAETRRERV